MPSESLTFAAHVGAFVSAALFEDGLLAICLAAGSRGEHRVTVVDTARAFARVASFPIPGRVRSGVTRILAAGPLVVTGDDHSVSGYHARTGERAFHRAFPAAAKISLHDAREDRLLVSIHEPDKGPLTALLRATDAADAEVYEGVNLAGTFAVALGPRRQLAIPHMSVVQIARPGAPTRDVPFQTRKYGVVDAVSFDDAGDRLALGTRAGEVVVLDLRTGKESSVLDLPAQVRETGFLGQDLWAIDGDARLRVVSPDPARALSVDLAISTYGGILAPDRASVALSDYEARTFRVVSVPDKAPLFTTLPGFLCQSVAIARDGSLHLGDSHQVIRLSPTTGRIQTVLAGDVSCLRTLPDGALFFGDSPCRVLRPGEKKPRVLGGPNEGYEISPDGAQVVLTNGLQIEVWDLHKRVRLSHLDLADSWVADHGHALRTAHLAPDGELYIHLSDGSVFRARTLQKGRPAHQLPDEGHLAVSPDGRTLYRTAGRTLERTRVRGWKPAPPLRTPVDADISVLHFSPSGDTLCAFHRNGQLALFDTKTGAAVVVESPTTSAAERAPHEVYIVDLMVPQQCAFSRDARRLAWTSGGGLTFADVATGKLLGRLLLTTGARAFAAEMGGSFDWTTKSARRPDPLPDELTATLDGRPLPLDALAPRRVPGLLSRLV